MNQSATAGALSASIAHELNQPLGAIRINAEAAEMMLRGEKPDLKLIQPDSRRHPRRRSARLRHHRPAANIAEETKRDRLAGVRPERRGQERDPDTAWRSGERRSVVVSCRPIRGRSCRCAPIRVHLQQVILNLATNAMDAMLEAGCDRAKAGLSGETEPRNRTTSSCRFPIPDTAFQAIGSRAYSTRSTRPSRPGPDWDCRSRAQ